MPANTEKASAGRNLLIYAAIVAVVAAYTVLVWGQREDLEGYGYPSGLGDNEVFDVDANPLDPESPMVTIDGSGYFAAEKPDGWRDRYMVRVGRDDGDQYYVYQVSEEIGGGPYVEGGDLYIKLSKDEYIKVAPAS